MKALIALSLALALSANAQTPPPLNFARGPVKLGLLDRCPDDRPALFLPRDEAIRQGGELAATRAEAAALRESHARMKRTAVISIVSAALAIVAAGVAAGVAVDEASKAKR